MRSLKKVDKKPVTLYPAERKSDLYFLKYIYLGLGVVVVVEGPSVLYWRPRTAAGPGVGLLLRLPYICHKEDQLLFQECNLSLSSWKQGQIFFVEGIFVKDENMYLAEGHVANNQNHQETFLVNTDSALCSNT